MHRRSTHPRTWAGALLALTLAAPLHAQEQQGAVDIPIETYQLGNGLKVILSPDRSTPVVAVDVWYDVGSRNERPGRSGFAHLFEHMMFQGSANVAKGEHMTLIERAGGSMNGTTSEDRTNYFETLPSNRLNLGLWLEADRMHSLAITEENFTNQREVVKEERRLSIDNSPYGAAFVAAAYDIPYDADGCFAYAHSVLGSMEDLDAAELSDVQDFFDTYYAPNNATLTVVGDFDTAEAKQLIEQYFAEIPAGPAPPPVSCENPFSKLPVRQTIEDANANLPGVMVVYGGPATGDPDGPALALLASVLGQGESSRLHQRLMRDEPTAMHVETYVAGRRGPGLVSIIAIANQGVAIERVERLVEEEIDRIRTRGITADELETAKMQYVANSVRSLQTVLGRAERLQHHAHFQGDPAAIRTHLDRYAAVTAADVQRVAAKYLVPDNRAVVIVEPAAGTTAAQEEAR